MRKEGWYRICETGDVRQDTWDKRQETWDVRQETGGRGHAIEYLRLLTLSEVLFMLKDIVIVLSILAVWLSLMKTLTH